MAVAKPHRFVHECDIDTCIEGIGFKLYGQSHHFALFDSPPPANATLPSQRLETFSFVMQHLLVASLRTESTKLFSQALRFFSLMHKVALDLQVQLGLDFSVAKEGSC